jgi:hypothetical protein
VETILWLLLLEREARENIDIDAEFPRDAPPGIFEHGYGAPNVLPGFEHLFYQRVLVGFVLYGWLPLTAGREQVVRLHQNVYPEVWERGSNRTMTLEPAHYPAVHFWFWFRRARDPGSDVYEGMWMRAPHTNTERAWFQSRRDFRGPWTLRAFLVHLEQRVAGLHAGDWWLRQGVSNLLPLLPPDAQ